MQIKRKETKKFLRRFKEFPWAFLFNSHVSQLDFPRHPWKATLANFFLVFCTTLVLFFSLNLTAVWISTEMSLIKWIYLSKSESSVSLNHSQLYDFLRHFTSDYIIPKYNHMPYRMCIWINILVQSLIMNDVSCIKVEWKGSRQWEIKLANDDGRPLLSMQIREALVT